MRISLPPWAKRPGETSLKKSRNKTERKYVAKRFVDRGGRSARPLGRRPTHRGGSGRGRAAPRAPDSHRTDHCRPGHLHARALRQRRLRPQGHSRPGRGQCRGKQYLQRPAHRRRGRPRGPYDDPAVHGLQGCALRPRGLRHPAHDVSERLGHHAPRRRHPLRLLPRLHAAHDQGSHLGPACAAGSPGPGSR